MRMPAMQDANFDCSSTGFALQAMDSSHVSLIHMQVWPSHLLNKLASCYVCRLSTQFPRAWVLEDLWHDL